MFLAREEELSLLEEDYLKASSSYICLFARKNIGKTVLLNEYSKNKKRFYISFTEISETLYFNNLSKFIYNFFEISSRKKISSFSDFLLFLTDVEVKQKTVIILDDFNILLKINKNALSLFYEYWKKDLKKQNLQIILSSSVHSSKKEFTSIYDNANKRIVLEELDYSIITKIIKDIPKKDLMYVYACFGSNIALLEQYDVKKDFLLNVKELILLNKKHLYTDAITLLKYELSDISTYSSILYAISMGNNKIGDIASYIDVKSSFLTRYIQKLVDLMIIEKEIPLNDDPIKSKFGRYDVKDNFTKFWFCYIFPYSFLLEQNNFYPITAYIRNDFSKRLVHKAYKKYVMTIIKKDSFKFLGYEAIKISSWWNNKTSEIDIIAYNKKEITFLDCQWRKNEPLELSYSHLKTKSKLFVSPLKKNYIIFAKK